jgi:hypothetical protein
MPLAERAWRNWSTPPGSGDHATRPAPACAAQAAPWRVGASPCSRRLPPSGCRRPAAAGARSSGRGMGALSTPGRRRLQGPGCSGLNLCGTGRGEVVGHQGRRTPTASHRIPRPGLMPQAQRLHHLEADAAKAVPGSHRILSGPVGAPVVLSDAARPGPPRRAVPPQVDRLMASAG